MNFPDIIEKKIVLISRVIKNTSYITRNSKRLKFVGDQLPHYPFMFEADTCQVRILNFFWLIGILKLLLHAKWYQNLNSRYFSGHECKSSDTSTNDNSDFWSVPDNQIQSSLMLSLDQNVWMDFLSCQKMPILIMQME